MEREGKDNDLIKYINLTNEEIQEKVKGWRDDLNLTDESQRWLAYSYIYAKENDLKEYQARSFASELTLFITGEMIQTDVDLIYREDWIDSHFYEKYQEILIGCNGKQDDMFWGKFISYMMGFYTSPISWHYERVTHQINIKLSEYEYEMFMKVPAKKNIDKFIYLLQSYDPNKSVEFERDESTRQVVFKIGESVYELLMSVPAKKKSQKFLNCLYQYISLI